MSDDIERLKKVLEDMRVSNDTLAGQVEVMADVFAAVTVLDPTANPEAYGDLVAVVREFQPEFIRLVQTFLQMNVYISNLFGKVNA